MATIPAYSTLLWALSPPYGPLGDIAGPTVPAGRVWIVRQVSAVVTGSAIPGAGILGLALAVNALQIWRTPLNATIAGEIYEATDVRYVLEAGQQLVAVTIGASWNLRVSGYDLSA